MFSDNNGTTAISQVQKLAGGVDGTCINLGAGAPGGPEPTDVAINMVMSSGIDFLGTFRSNVAKYIVVVTDDLPGGDDGQFTAVDYAYINTLTLNANAEGIKIIVCGAGVNGTYNNGGTIVYPWQELALNTGGNFNVNADVSQINALLVASCS